MHCLAQEKWRAVVHILKALVEDYAYSPQANCRKGGAPCPRCSRSGSCRPQGGAHLCHLCQLQSPGSVTFLLILLFGSLFHIF